MKRLYKIRYKGKIYYTQAYSSQQAAFNFKYRLGDEWSFMWIRPF